MSGKYTVTAGRLLLRYSVVCGEGSGGGGASARGGFGDDDGDVGQGALYVGEDLAVVGQHGAVPVLFGGDPVDLVAQGAAVVGDQFDGVALDGLHGVHDAAGGGGAPGPRGPRPPPPRGGGGGGGGARGCCFQEGASLVLWRAVFSG